MIAAVNLFGAGLQPLYALAAWVVVVGALYFVARRASAVVAARRQRAALARAGSGAKPRRERPRWLRRTTPFALILVALLLPPFEVFVLNSTQTLTVTFDVAAFAVLAVGLNIVVGYTGLLDLGYVAFYAVGAYTFGLLGSSQLAPLIHHTIYFLVPAGSGGEGLHISMWVVLPIAGLVAAIFGVIIGYPTLRLRGDYLAIVTLGFGEITRLFAQNLFQPVNITNGSFGISQIDSIWLGNYNFGSAHEILGVNIPPYVNYYYVVLVVLLLTMFFVARLATSRVGRAWAAIREDELAAEASGINTRNLKLLAYASGGFFGGMSGALFASAQDFISPESFGFTISIFVLVMVVVGGMGNLYGVILGAIAVGGAYFETGQFGQLRVLVFGILLVAMVILRPQGILPSRIRQRELAAAELGPETVGKVAVEVPGGPT